MQIFVWRCLVKADENKFSTLAFPALGAGALAFPPDMVAKIMKETVNNFEKSHPDTTLRKIVFVIYYTDKDIFKVRTITFY